MTSITGDILLTQEATVSGTSGLSVLRWDGKNLVALPLALGEGSAPVGQWEHVTLADVSIVEVQ